MGRSISRAAIALVLSTLFLAPFKAASAATGDILRVFANPTPALGDNFGVSVAAVGPNVLVGADSDNTGFTDSGSAYLLNGDTGELMLSIRNPTPAVNENFGRTVAAHGSNLLVSAYRFSGTSGEAMLFDGVTGDLIWNLKPVDTSARPRFGESMASWGQEIIVGAPQNESSSRVFLFETATGNELGSVAIGSSLPDADGVWRSADRFGLALSGLGDGFAIGDPLANFRSTGGEEDETGGVFIYDAGATFVRSLRRPGPETTRGFGASLAARGSDILVGDHRSYELQPTAGQPGAAFLFDSTTGELLHSFVHPSPSNGDRFGAAVAFVGSNVLVTAATDDQGNPGGAVFLFDGLTGDLLHTYRNPSPSTISNFGISNLGPSLAALGNNILIGASDADVGAVNSGAVYLFEGYTPRGGRTDLTLTLGQIAALAPMFEEPENPVSGAIFSQRPLDGGIEFEVSLADPTGGDPPMALVGLGATAGGLGLVDITGHDRFGVMVTNTDNSAWSVAAFVQADGGERYQGTQLRLPAGASHTIDLDLLAIPGGEAALANIASLGLVIVGQLEGAGGNPSNSDVAHLLVKPLDGAHSVPEPSAEILLCMACATFVFVQARRCRAASRRNHADAARDRSVRRRVHANVSAAKLIPLATLVATFAAPTARADFLFAGARIEESTLTALRATGRLAQSLDTLDVSQVTPTLETLLQYDAVLVLSNLHFDDSALLGDRLADYVDAGGGVVVTPFLFRNDPNLSLQGRWASGGYNPIPVTGGEHQGTWTLAQVHQPGHPVLDGALGITFSSSFTTDAPVAGNFDLIAEWQRGDNVPVVPLVAESRSFSGRVMLFNAFPDPAHLNAAGFNLLANTMNYAAVPEPRAFLLVLVGAGIIVLCRRRVRMGLTQCLTKQPRDGSSASQCCDFQPHQAVDDFLRGSRPAERLFG